MKTNLLSFILIFLGEIALCVGTFEVFAPAGIILAGLLVIATGILTLERGEKS